MAARLLVAVILAGAIVAIALILRAMWRDMRPRNAEPVRSGSSSSDGWANTPFWRWVARLAAMAALLSISGQLFYEMFVPH